MRIRTTTPKGRSLAAVGLLGLSLLVAACGGGASAAAVGDDETTNAAGQAATDQAATDQGGAAAMSGDYADEEWIAGAVAALDAHDSYTFEIETTAESSYGEETRRTYGVVRPSDDAAIVNFEIEGSVSQYVTIGDKSWIDYGDNQYRPQDEPDESREVIRNVWDEFFASYADDFVVVGPEKTHGRATIHVVIDPDYVENKVEQFGEEYRGWTLDLWLAEDDGHLVRAVYGGPLAPISFGVPRFTLDVKSVDCECPVTEPR